MSDQTIKDRVRKLMAVAGDGVATDGEIDNAMRLAAKLIDQHHLKPEDYQAEEKPDDLTMGRSYGTSRGVKFSTWEGTLASALEHLFGCVKCYVDHGTQPIRINGIAETNGGEIKRGRKVAFYGPATESQEAAELFTEWARSIATMGVARWGGCMRGDGAMYCYGFASALLTKARTIDESRVLVEARPIPQLQGETSTAITLANRYELLRDAGSKWLKEELKVSLHSRGRSSGYSGGNDAYREGGEHGSKAEFGRAAKRKMLT